MFKDEISVRLANCAMNTGSNVRRCRRECICRLAYPVVIVWTRILLTRRADLQSRPPHRSTRKQTPVRDKPLTGRFIAHRSPLEQPDDANWCETEMRDRYCRSTAVIVRRSDTTVRRATQQQPNRWTLQRKKQCSAWRTVQDREASALAPSNMQSVQPCRPFEKSCLKRKFPDATLSAVLCFFAPVRPIFLCLLAGPA